MIKCPCCLSDLEVTHQDRYETLIEHVEEREPSMKDGYQCPNSFCKAYEMNGVWIEEGDFWIKEPPALMNYIEAEEEVEKHSFTGTTFAVNSFADGYHRYNEDKKNREVSLNLWWFIFTWTPLYQNIEGTNEWKRTGKWKRTIMRRASEGRYIHFMTFWDIFFFELEVYKTNYSKAIAKDENALEIMQANIRNENIWGLKEDRFWWKLARFTVCWILFPNKSRIIKNIR
jgi:hypothetical protein